MTTPEILPQNDAGLMDQRAQALHGPDYLACREKLRLGVKAEVLGQASDDVLQAWRDGCGPVQARVDQMIKEATTMAPVRKRIGEPTDEALVAKAIKALRAMALSFRIPFGAKAKRETPRIDVVALALGESLASRNVLVRSEVDRLVRSASFWADLKGAEPEALVRDFVARVAPREEAEPKAPAVRDTRLQREYNLRLSAWHQGQRRTFFQHEAVSAEVEMGAFVQAEVWTRLARIYGYWNLTDLRRVLGIAKPWEAKVIRSGYAGRHPSEGFGIGLMNKLIKRSVNLEEVSPVGGGSP